MKLSTSKRKQKVLPDHIPVLTGTAIPLGALKTTGSCSCGEYPDLIPFADFCKQSGLELIQLLPVNDTGTDSSPYNTLSAFALHPLYISIARLPEFAANEAVQQELSDIKTAYEHESRFNYTDLRRAKLTLLRRIYDEQADVIASSSELQHWISKNQWIIPYAVFMRFKALHQEASWKSWELKARRMSADTIKTFWEDDKLSRDHLFFAWMQMRAAQQFSQAADYIRSLGIILKGDIPIHHHAR